MSFLSLHVSPHSKRKQLHRKSVRIMRLGGGQSLGSCLDHTTDSCPQNPFRPLYLLPPLCTPILIATSLCWSSFTLWFLPSTRPLLPPHLHSALSLRRSPQPALSAPPGRHGTLVHRVPRSPLASQSTKLRKAQPLRSGVPQSFQLVFS